MYSQKKVNKQTDSKSSSIAIYDFIKYKLSFESQIIYILTNFNLLNVLLMSECQRRADIKFNLFFFLISDAGEEPWK